MWYVSLIIVAVVGVALFALLKIFANKQADCKALQLTIKVLGCVLLGLLTVRGFLSDGFTLVINGGYYCDDYYKNIDVLATFVRWANMFACCVAITSVFCDSKLLKNLLIYFCLPITVLSLGYVHKLVEYALMPTPRGYVIATWLRVAGIVLEYAITILLPLIYYFICNYKQDFANKTETKDTVKLGVIGFVMSMPFLTLGSLFGGTGMVMEMFSIWHVLWIVSVVLAFFVVFLAFRNNELTNKKAMMYFLIVYLFIHYNSIYTHGLNMGRLPLQLCNLGAYLLLVLMLTGSQKLFDFIYVANCPGCLVAIMTIPLDDNMFEFWSTHYFVEHSLVMIIPLLLSALKIFNTPSVKDAFKHYLVGFNVYFFTCLFANGIENGILNKYLGDNGFFTVANFFYLIECPIADVLPFSKSLLVCPLNIFGCTAYLPYLLFVYFVFSAIAFAMYFANVGLHKLIYKLPNKQREQIVAEQ